MPRSKASDDTIDRAILDMVNAIQSHPSSASGIPERLLVTATDVTTTVYAVTNPTPEQYRNLVEHGTVPTGPNVSNQHSYVQSLYPVIFDNPHEDAVLIGNKTIPTGDLIPTAKSDEHTAITRLKNILNKTRREDTDKQRIIDANSKTIEDIMRSALGAPPREDDSDEFF